nr:hypothetical protein [Nostoc sp. WHI]
MHINLYYPANFGLLSTDDKIFWDSSPYVCKTLGKMALIGKTTLQRDRCNS